MPPRAVTSPCVLRTSTCAARTPASSTASRACTCSRAAGCASPVPGAATTPATETPPAALLRLTGPALSSAPPSDTPVWPRRVRAWSPACSTTSGAVEMLPAFALRLSGLLFSARLRVIERSRPAVISSAWPAAAGAASVFRPVCTATSRVAVTARATPPLRSICAVGASVTSRPAISIRPPGPEACSTPPTARSVLLPPVSEITPPRAVAAVARTSPCTLITWSSRRLTVSALSSTRAASTLPCWSTRAISGRPWVSVTCSSCVGSRIRLTRRLPLRSSTKASPPVRATLPSVATIEPRLATWRPTRAAMPPSATRMLPSLTTLAVARPGWSKR